MSNIATCFRVRSNEVQLNIVYVGWQVKVERHAGAQSEAAYVKATTTTSFLELAITNNNYGLFLGRGIDGQKRFFDRSRGLCFCSSNLIRDKVVQKAVLTPLDQNNAVSGQQI